ncbi:glycoside hydrolase family 108 protein [Thermoflexus sp.]|uniref:glycoside hydrolase family 108 protein n=1 Tax=Thermoflexus sp. TaxID=1969742 RepID=UPI0035E442FC
MSSSLRIHPEEVRQQIQRLREWRAEWAERLRTAQWLGIALIETVHAVPGRGFQTENKAQARHLGRVEGQVELLARTLEQALARLEDAFQEAARLLQEPILSATMGTLPTAAVAASFEEAYAFIRKWEGGYGHDPHDRGGPTNMGITQATYDDYRRRHGLPPQEVARITPAEAEAIYREFWEQSGAGRLPRPLGLVHMDTAVNMGPGRAQQFLQEVQQRNPGTPEAAVEAYLDLRLNRYLELARDPSQRRFLAGWLNRLQDLSGHAVSPEFQRAFREKILNRLTEDPEFTPTRDFLVRLWAPQGGRNP